MATYLRRPSLTIQWLNVATEVDITNTLEASTTWGLDLPTSEATFTVPTLDDLHGATYFSYVSITLTYTPDPNADDGYGLGHTTAPIWQGFITNFSYSYYPRGVTVHCKGPLVLCQLQENPAYSDGSGTAPTGGGTVLAPADGHGITDDEIILDLLTASSADSLAGSIEPTGNLPHPRILGTIAPQQFRWNEGESALSVIQRLDAISATQVSGVWLLLRTYDDKNGSIRRKHFDMVPTGTPGADHTFTEEVDIFDASAEHDILAAKNRIAVTGYDKGDGSGAVNYTVSVSNTLLTRASYITLPISSPMIEVQTEADVVSYTGTSCEGVANAHLRIWKTVQQRATYTTPLDKDVDLGDTIAIATGGATTERLGNSGASTLFWVQRYTRHIDPQGAFSIEYTVLRGAG